MEDMRVKFLGACLQRSFVTSWRFEPPVIIRGGNAPAARVEWCQAASELYPLLSYRLAESSVELVGRGDWVVH